ncbi:MAG: DUF2157 domain-containing protein [Thermogutta sp.]
MTARRLSPKFFRWLGEEIAAWEAEGLISADQARELSRRYATVSEFPGLRANLVTLIFSSIASLLVIVGVVLLISFYWEQFSPAVRLGILLGGTLGLNVLGLVVRRYSGEWRLLSDAIFLMAGILFGASIFLLPQFQIYGSSLRAGDGMLLWAVGALPLVLVLDRPLFYIGFNILLISMLVTVSAEDTYRLDRDYFASVLLVILAPSLVRAYAGRSFLSCLATGLGFCWWLTMPITFGNSLISLGSHLVIAGTAAWVLAEWSRLARPMSSVFRFCGAGMTAIAFLFLSGPSNYGEWQWAYEPRPRVISVFTHPLDFIPVVILVAVILGDLLFPAPPQRSERLRRRFEKFLVPCVCLGIALLIVGLMHTDFVSNVSFTAVATAWGNIGAVICATSLIVLGVAYSHTDRLFIGLGTFLIWLWLRWDDLFDTDKITGAVLFIVSGILFWIVVGLWLRYKQRLKPVSGGSIPDRDIPGLLVGARNWLGRYPTSALMFCILVECAVIIVVYLFV